MEGREKKADEQPRRVWDRRKGLQRAARQLPVKAARCREKNRPLPSARNGTHGSAGLQIPGCASVLRPEGRKTTPQQPRERREADELSGGRYAPLNTSPSHRT